MAFLSCEEMLAAARTQNISLAEAVLRSDLAESRLTEEQSRHGMRHLWHVMEATSRDYDPAQRSRSGLSGGDAAKVEQAHRAGRSYGGDYLAEVTAEALKTAECNACMKRIVAAPTAGSCGVLPAVLLPLARAGEADETAICEALYVAAGFGQVIAARATLAGAEGGCQAEVGAASAMAAAALVDLKGGTAEQCGGRARQTADAAGHEQANPRHVRRNHRTCNCCCAIQPLRNRQWEVASADLQHVLRGRHVFDLFSGQTDLDPAADDRDRRARHVLADDPGDGLDVPRELAPRDRHGPVARRDQERGGVWPPVALGLELTEERHGGIKSLRFK